MSIKTISMSVTDSDGGTVNITQRYNGDCSWMAMAYQFYCLLAAQGYRLDTEDVGADVESYIAATENVEETW